MCMPTLNFPGDWQATECGVALTSAGGGNYGCSSPCWDQGTCERLEEFSGEAARPQIDACWDSVNAGNDPTMCTSCTESTSIDMSGYPDSWVECADDMDSDDMEDSYMPTY